jgi:hypothetical protein
VVVAAPVVTVVPLVRTVLPTPVLMPATGPELIEELRVSCGLVARAGLGFTNCPLASDA